MTNAELFKNTFNGLMATELWAMPEKEFLEWLNSKPLVKGEARRMSDTIKDDCLFCIDHEAGSVLYEYVSWEGGIEFRTVENIKYCPLCGKRLLSGEAYGKMLDEKFGPNRSGEVG